jgi:thioredoxin 1
MSVQEITSYNQFTTVINSVQYVVIDFYANWCGPCKNIAPSFSKFSTLPQFSQVKFLKVNVDDVPEIAQLCKVAALPTFVTFKRGQIHNKITGSNEQNVISLITSLLK